MQIRTSVWIEDRNGKIAYGLGRQRILQAIRDTGSMTAAAEALGLSYRGLWARLRHSERRLGFPLVVSRPGRGKGGGTRLTPQATRLLVRYEKVVRQVYEASDRAFARHLHRLLKDHATD